MIDKTAVHTRQRQRLLVRPAGDKDSPMSRASSWNATSPLTGSTVPSKPSSPAMRNGRDCRGESARRPQAPQRLSAGQSRYRSFGYRRRQIDRNARARDLESGRAHRAANAPARLHDLHTRDAEHLDARDAARKRAPMMGIASTPRIQAAWTARFRTPSRHLPIERVVLVLDRRYARREW